MLEFANCAEHRAKKEYKCTLCGELILVRNQYVRYFGKCDGYIFDDKYHKTCKSIINKYCEKTGENEYDSWCIHDWIAEDVCCDICNNVDRSTCSCDVYKCDKVLSKLGIIENDMISCT